MNYFLDAVIEYKSSICQLAQHLCNRAQAVANVGVDGYFYRRFQYKEPGISNSRLGMVTPTVALAQATRPQWRRTSCALGKVWNTVVGASLLLIPLSIALLQIESVGTQQLGQTLAIATFLLAAAGLLSSLIFKMEGDNMRSERVRLYWLEASRRADEAQSVRFWSLLALPVVCTLWSIFFATATVLYIPWATANPDARTSRLYTAAYFFIMAVAASLNFYLYFQVYRVKNFTNHAQ